MDFKVGDEVVAINDVLTTDQEVFVNEVRKERIGTTLRFLVRRDGQTLKVNGKIGSYNKTMVALQDAARKERIGKPLPPPPAALWWNAATAVWEEKPGALADLKDKLAVVISFDNCGFCKEEKVKKVAAMKSALQQTAAGAPLAFTGFFFNEARTRDECLKDARELLQAVPVNFPVAVTYFPSPPAPEAKREQVLLTQHGVAILEPKGTVVYLQTYGTLGPDFLAAFQNAARGLPAGAKVEDPGAAGKPPGKP
jgi:hypothetical protein